MGTACSFLGVKSTGQWKCPLSSLCRSIVRGTRLLHSYDFMTLTRLIFLYNSRTLCSRKVSYVVSITFFCYGRLNTSILLWKLWISQWRLHEPSPKLLCFMSGCLYSAQCCTDISRMAGHVLYSGLFCPGGNSYPNLLAQKLPATITS
jgi:hypothetical protein